MGKIFFVDFSDCHTIMKMIKLFSMISSHFLLIFTEEGLSIEPEYVDDKTQVAARQIINKSKFITYYVNSVFFNRGSEGYHIVKVNIGIFKRQIGSPSRKDGFILYQDSEDARKMHIDTHSSEGSISPGDIFLESSAEYRPLNFSDGFEREESNPNFRIPVTSIVKAGKHLQKIKCNKNKIAITGEQFVMQGFNSGDKSNRSFPYRMINPEEYSRENRGDEGSVISSGECSLVGEELFQIPISKNLMNVFINLNGITAGGICSIYAEKNNPILRIFTPLGFYGTLELYILPERDRKE